MIWDLKIIIKEKNPENCWLSHDDKSTNSALKFILRPALQYTLDNSQVKIIKLFKHPN